MLTLDSTTTFITVVCQYQWACTEPNKSGQRYLPSVRDRQVQTTQSFGTALFVYRIVNLNASCYGPVTAIEYCYRYTTSAGSGQPTFNWTVLILEDTGSNNFVIKYTYAIQSCGSAMAMGSANCTSSGDQVTCCDVTNIRGFYLHTNLTFGVIESAQGNTHGATLLGFHDSLTQYGVSTIVFSRDGLNFLPVGSSLVISDNSAYEGGLRMLWFIIGKIQQLTPINNGRDYFLQ